MLLDEIIQLDQWLTENEKNYGIIQKLQELLTVLNANVQAITNRNQAIQPFTEQKNAAIEAVSKYNLGELSDEQIACLHINNADKYMGPDASNEIMAIFRDDGHDIAYLATEIQKVHQALNSAKSQIAATSKSISPYAEAVSSTEYLTDQARFSIIFKEGVSIENLSDFETRAKEWNGIMHGIGMGLGVAPNEFKVLGARNGSVVIDLYMTALAIIPIGFILIRCLNILENFALSIKRIDGVFGTDINDPAFKEIEEEIKATSEKYFNINKLVTAKKIADGVLDEIECEPDRRNEASVFLESSIKKILNHLRKGGDLDAFVPDKSLTNDEDEINEDLTEAYKNITEFRHKKLELSNDLVKLLEYFDFEENTDEPESED